MDFHNHPFFEMGLTIGGSGHYEIKSAVGVKTVEVSPDTLLFWSGKLAHRAVDNKGTPLRQVILCFNEVFLNSSEILKAISSLLSENDPFVIRHPFHLSFFKEILRQMLSSVNKKDLLTSEVQRARMILLCDRIIELSCLTSPTKSNHGKSKDERVKITLEYLNHHWHENLTIDNIAAKLSISQRRFSTLFKSETGTTFVNYLQNLRVERAKRELCCGEVPITNIAFQSGFESVSQFNRVFKKSCGCSPREWRQLPHLSEYAQYNS